MHGKHYSTVVYSRVHLLSVHYLDQTDCYNSTDHVDSQRVLVLSGPHGGSSAILDYDQLEKMLKSARSTHWW